MLVSGRSAEVLVILTGHVASRDVQEGKVVFGGKGFERIFSHVIVNSLHIVALILGIFGIVGNVFLKVGSADVTNQVLGGNREKTEEGKPCHIKGKQRLVHNVEMIHGGGIGNVFLQVSCVLIAVIMVGINIDAVIVGVEKLEKFRVLVGVHKILGTGITEIVLLTREHVGDAGEGAGIHGGHVVKVGKAVQIVKDLGALFPRFLVIGHVKAVDDKPDHVLFCGYAV